MLFTTGRPLWAAILLLGLATSAPAHAATATLTLSRNVALWTDTVEARIEGTGCSGETDPPFVAREGGSSVIDIDLLGCQGAPGGAPFSTVVSIGPLAPERYTVRVHDAARHIVSSSPPPLATALLSVHPDASLGIEVPITPTDAAPFTLVLSGPERTSPCARVSPPGVGEGVIAAIFTDDCGSRPPRPNILREEFPLGPLPAGTYEVRFFDLTFSERWPTLPLERTELVVYHADGCVPGDLVLCLQNGRFKVEAEWTDFSGNSGNGHALPLAGDANTGLLWFFSPDNVEVTVKVLEGCPVNGHWWVFLSSGSTVEYTVTVTDTVTGVSREYTNDSGEAAPLVTDTQAFDC